MKCLKYHYKYINEQNEKEWERKQKEEQAKIEAMTEEEREKYFRKKEEEHKRIKELLSIPYELANGPYSYLK